MFPLVFGTTTDDSGVCNTFELVLTRGDGVSTCVGTAGVGVGNESLGTDNTGTGADARESY